jgi:alpha-N-arabinofuranosidase
MRQADRGSKIGAILDENYPRSVGRAFPNWTEEVLKTAGSQIDFVSVHLGYAPVIPNDLGWNPRTVYSAMLAAPSLIGDQLADITRRINVLVPGRASQIGIAVTEWSPLFQGTTTGQYVDHTKTLGSALFAASALKNFIESPQTEVANVFKLVDPGFMGWIGVRQNSYAAKATALAMQMFTAHFGTNLISSATVGPVYDSTSVGWVDAVGGVPYIETVSSTSQDGMQLYVMVINKHFERAIRARISIAGFSPAGTATAFTLNGVGLDSNTGTQPLPTAGVVWAAQAQVQPNSQFDKGSENAVTISTAALTGTSASFEYQFPAHSITSIVLPRNH